MHLRFFSKLTFIFVTFIVFSSCISFLSVKQVALAKSYKCTQTSGSGITASAEARCSGPPTGRPVPKELPGLSKPGAGNANYFYAGGLQSFPSDGAAGNFNQPWPMLDQKDSHTLAELAVAFFNQNNVSQAIEVGWTVDRSLNRDDTPHLFTSYWVDGKWKGYNPTDPNIFKHISGTILPGDGVVVDRSPNTTHQYVIRYYQGNWWIGYNDVWIGYFPGSVWQGRFTQSNVSEWYGEVATYQPVPCSQMGDGILGSDAYSSTINNMYFIVNNTAKNASAQKYQPTSSDYDTGHFSPSQTGFNSFTYGGPGDTKGCSQTSANWPMFGYDATGTRYNPIEHTISPSNAGKLVKGWSALGGGDVNSPVVDNGAVYIDGVNGKLYAFNATTGKSLWASSTIGNSNGQLSTAAVTNSDVYVGSPDGHLYALSVSTGQTLWKYATGGAVYTPTVENGVVYFGSADQNMYAINASTGKLLWKYHTGGTVTSTPAVANGVVYFSSSDFYLHAVDASTGTKRWTSLLNYCSPGSPAVANNVVYVETACDLEAVNVGTGAILWTDSTCGVQYGTAAVANGVVYIGSTSGNNAYMCAYDATKKAPPLWSQLTDGVSFGSSPAVANGVVYIGSNYGSMYAFNADSGAVLWKHAYGNQVFSSPVVANGILYVGEFGAYLDTFHL